MIPLRLKIEGVRAVSRADIQISGLTVLCGPNCAGKSTIARILEDSIEANLYFDHRHRNEILVGYINQVLENFQKCLFSLKVEESGSPLFSSVRWILRSLTSCDEAKKDLDDISELFTNVFAQKNWRQANPSGREMQVLADKLKVKNATLEKIEAALWASLKKLSDELMATVDERLSYDLFLQAEMSSPVLWRGNVDICEAEERVLSYRGESNSEYRRLISVRDVIYIESPLVTSMEWSDGRLSLKGNFASLHTYKRTHVNEDEIADAFAKVMRGSVRLKKSPSGRQRWMYCRADKKEFPLVECATGLKAFSLLSTLYAHGCLNSETVLIIDEPEAHLHPQWVVEYAKMIVSLVSTFGVRTLIASHDPDMINALQAFASARGIEDRTHFYQAIPDGGAASYCYKYLDRKMDVGRIFDTFNKVYPAIDKGVLALSH